ncbi:MAG: HNH endonuclease [Actinomycetia bacterium]|nr:HNH endonuclease [Actinomycetes bacterium]
MAGPVALAGPGPDGLEALVDGPGAIAALGSAVDRLARLDWPRLPGPDLLDLARELEVQKRRLAGVDQALLAQLSLRHVAGEKGYRDTASLLVHQLRISPAEARARVGDAADYGPSATLTGQPLPPVFPELAAAIGAGEVSVGHARAITRFVDAVPRDLPEAVVQTAQEHLLKAAAETHPGQVAKLATALLARLDQDGPEPHEDAEQRRRGLTLSTGADGWSKADGHLSPLLTASLNALFDSLGAPKPAADGAPDDRTPAARRHDALLDAAQRLLRSGSLPDSGGAPITILVTLDETDLRERVAEATGPGTASGRRTSGGSATRCATSGPNAAANDADASSATDTSTAPHVDTAPHDPVRAHGHSGAAAANDTETATTTDASAAPHDPDRADRSDPNPAADTDTGESLAERVAAVFGRARPGPTGHDPGEARGYGVTSHGHLLPIADVLALAAEAEIIPIVLNDAGGIVSYGRSQRLATPAMRRALAARDSGCSFPGCDIPPEWCQVHHVTRWEHGGHTALSDLAFLCGHHHRQHERQGWTCQMINGVPHWIPPAWIDPKRKPRRNHAHTQIRPQQCDQAGARWLDAA